MVKKKTKKILNNIFLFWFPILIVAISHIGIIAMGLPQELIKQHAALNLFAVVLLLAHYVLEEFVI